MAERAFELAFLNSSDRIGHVRTDAEVKTSESAPTEIPAPGSGSHTLQANRGVAVGADSGVFQRPITGNNLERSEDVGSKRFINPSLDRYVASWLGGGSASAYQVFPETFPAYGTYVHNALDLIDGSTVRPGARLPVRKNKTTQTIGTKESYCPICELILATAWAKHHLTSRQHRFNVALLPQEATR